MSINKHSLEHTGFIDVEGGQIGYRHYIPHEDKARKRTPLIIVHGGPGSSTIGMYDCLNKLADERPVIFYDQLGSALSPHDMTPDLMRVDRFVDELFLLMKGLSLIKAHILGHSWGGVIVTKFSLQHPEMVESLTLSSPLISTKRWVDDCNLLLETMPQNIQDTIHRCQTEGTTDSDEYRDAEKIFSKSHFIRMDNPPTIVQRERLNTTVYNTMWGPSEFSHDGTLGDLDLFPQLKHIEQPTLVITGEFDTATPQYMKEIQQEISNARLEVMPDSGHVTYIDQNDLYIESLNKFLQGLVTEKSD